MSRCIYVLCMSFLKYYLGLNVIARMWKGWPLTLPRWRFISCRSQGTHWARSTACKRFILWPEGGDNLGFLFSAILFLSNLQWSTMARQSPAIPIKSSFLHDLSFLIGHRWNQTINNGKKMLSCNWTKLKSQIYCEAEKANVYAHLLRIRTLYPNVRNEPANHILSLLTNQRTDSVHFLFSRGRYYIGWV